MLLTRKIGAAGRLAVPVVAVPGSLAAHAARSGLGRRGGGACCCPAAPAAAAGPLSTSSTGLQRQRHTLAPQLPPLGIGMTPATAPFSPEHQRRCCQTVVARSFLGVGAPEALLVAVVALVVFGPKGLADAAKSLGQTLRAFQPTIREVVEVSQEIKGTLEQELGLDEIRAAARPAPRPIPPPAASTSTSLRSAADALGSGGAEGASSSGGGAGAGAGEVPQQLLRPASDAEARALDPDIELKRAMSEQAAWGGQQPPVAGGGAAAAGSGSGDKQDLSGLSLDELEAELARRRNAA